MFKAIIACCFFSIVASGAEPDLEKSIDVIRQHRDLAILHAMKGFHLSFEQKLFPPQGGEPMSTNFISSALQIAYPQYELDGKIYLGPVLQWIRRGSTELGDSEQIIFAFDFAVARSLGIASSFGFDRDENPIEFARAKEFFLETKASIAKHWDFACAKKLDAQP